MRGRRSLTSRWGDPVTLEATAAFSIAFLLLAVTPGPGLAAILSRALGGGAGAGLATTAGLVAGDALFLAAAMIGLSAIASALGPMFQIVKYAGAAYLIWIGVQAFRAARTPLHVSAAPRASLVRDFGLGLLVTLGNPKPILFYGALLPTFLDLKSATAADFFVMMTVVVVVSFLVYGVYIFMVERARRALATTRMVQRLNQASGVVLVGSGLVVASR